MAEQQPVCPGVDGTFTFLNCFYYVSSPALSSAFLCGSIFVMKIGCRWWPRWSSYEMLFCISNWDASTRNWTKETWQWSILMMPSIWGHQRQTRLWSDQRSKTSMPPMTARTQSYDVVACQTKKHINRIKLVCNWFLEQKSFWLGWGSLVLNMWERPWEQLGELRGTIGNSIWEVGGEVICGCD